MICRAPTVILVGTSGAPRFFFFTLVIRGGKSRLELKSGWTTATYCYCITFPAAEEYMKQYALDNAKKAGILKPERHNSLRLVRGIAESLPVEDNVADAVAWQNSPEERDW